MEPRLMAYIDEIDDASPNIEKMRGIAAAYSRRHPQESPWATQVVDTYIAQHEAERGDA
jgi:hypothetical protein